MAYKDKDKQREAQRERTRRYRAKEKGVTSQGVTHLASAIVESQSVATVLPAGVPMVVQERYNRYPCEPSYKDTINHLLEHTLAELTGMGTWIPIWRYTAGESING